MSHPNHQDVQCLFVTLKILARYTTEHILRRLEEAAPAIQRARLKHRHMRRFRKAMGNRHRGRFNPWAECMSEFLAQRHERCPITRYFNKLNSQIKTRADCNIFDSSHLLGLATPNATQTISRTLFTAGSGLLSRERHSFGKLGLPVQLPSSFSLQVQGTFNASRGVRLIHTYGQVNTPRPIETLRSNWIVQNTRLKNVRARPSTQPLFVYPQQSLYSTVSLSCFSAEAPESFVSRLKDLSRAFHITPEIGSYVDFDMSPTITVPPVAQLSSDIVENLTEDIEKHIEYLKAMADNLKKLASLGELPMSVDNGSLRVYFPNCEPDQVNSLLSSAEVTQGVVGSHTDTGVSSPMCSSNSEASFYMHSTSSLSSFPSSVSQNGDHTPDTVSFGFHYAEIEPVAGRRDSLSSEGWDIGRMRGFSSDSNASPSLALPSLTNAPSDETVSEGSSILFA